MKITTARLILRDFVAEDWRAVQAYQADSRYLRFNPWTERTEADVREFVLRFVNHQTQDPRRKFQLAITLPESGQLIGNVGIRRKPENEWEADIGYELAPAFWGQGYATEAARAIVAFGFRELGLHRISAECRPENTASAHVLEKLGLQREGWLREVDYFKDRWWDTWLYAILEHEWRAHNES